jgi:hypothetical protein
VETRPLYLHLTRERFAEPDAVCSDHAPWTLAAKLDPALDVVTDGDCPAEPGSGRWVCRDPAGQCQGLALPS